MSDDLLIIVMVSPLTEGPDSDQVAAWAVRLCGPEDVSRLGRAIRRDELFDPRARWQVPWTGPCWATPADIYKDLDDLGWSAVEWRPKESGYVTSVWSQPEHCP